MTPNELGAALNAADQSLTNLDSDNEAVTSAINAARSAINAARIALLAGEQKRGGISCR